MLTTNCIEGLIQIVLWKKMWISFPVSNQPFKSVWLLIFWSFTQQQ